MERDGRILSYADGPRGIIANFRTFFRKHYMPMMEPFVQTVTTICVGNQETALKLIGHFQDDVTFEDVTSDNHKERDTVIERVYEGGDWKIVVLREPKTKEEKEEYKLRVRGQWGAEEALERTGNLSRRLWGHQFVRKAKGTYAVDFIAVDSEVTEWMRNVLERENIEWMSADHIESEIINAKAFRTIWQRHRDGVWQEGFENGKMEGYRKGKDDGAYQARHEGYKKGFESGQYAGRREGFLKGFEKGFARGASTLWETLRTSFAYTTREQTPPPFNPEAFGGETPSAPPASSASSISPSTNPLQGTDTTGMALNEFEKWQLEADFGKSFFDGNTLFGSQEKAEKVVAAVERGFRGVYEAVFSDENAKKDGKEQKSGKEQKKNKKKEEDKTKDSSREEDRDDEAGEQR